MLKYLYTYCTGDDPVVGFILGALIVWAIFATWAAYTLTYGVI